MKPSEVLSSPRLDAPQPVPAAGTEPPKNMIKSIGRKFVGKGMRGAAPMPFMRSGKTQGF